MAVDVEQLQQQLKDSEVHVALLQAQAAAAQLEAGAARDAAAQLLAKHVAIETDHVRDCVFWVARRRCSLHSGECHCERFIMCLHLRACASSWHHVGFMISTRMSAWSFH